MCIGNESKRTPDSAKMSADIGLIGLSVMGSNLVLNMNDHGFTVCAFNRTVSKVDEFLANEAKGTNIVGINFTLFIIGHGLEEGLGDLFPTSCTSPKENYGNEANGEDHQKEV